MRPFSIIVFLLIINSSFSLFCYEQITNGEEKIIPCDTLCYTNVRITESLTEIVRRGCSDRLPFNVRATIYMKYGIYVEKPLCTGLENNKQEAQSCVLIVHMLCVCITHTWSPNGDVKVIMKMIRRDRIREYPRRVILHSIGHSMNLLLLFSLLISSSSAFKCLQGIGESSKLVECSSFCYSEFGVANKSSSLLKRGCSREMTVHDKLIYMVKFQMKPEDRECTENGISHISPLNRNTRRERICCDYNKCNGLRKEMEADSNNSLYILPVFAPILLRLFF
ncbi:hypothetical protein PRIPAC_77530 [Pristionchus pacificus]|uniref:Uncharacterized protein n=1 Tax=Pristionchus pacificus TaxID=54126 RepID=A0A2A6BE30_PRIPA|nr:hypothetical protein PRIPAC_77530 [Pristionchus pacificus]|eukprot:PDM64147.1 hypothetical protein PRIPAC_54391 [Pristionchus pacificus]